MAAGTVIYGISGDAVFKIDNTHGDSTPLPAAGAVIYGIFGDAAPEIGNTRGDSTPRAAKRLTLSRNCCLVHRICRVFTVQWGRIGVPHANRATWVSNVPRSCGPAGPKPRTAREPDDPDPQRTDKTRQNRHTRLRFLDIISVFADRDVESP